MRGSGGAKRLVSSPLPVAAVALIGPAVCRVRAQEQGGPARRGLRPWCSGPLALSCLLLLLLATLRLLYRGSTATAPATATLPLCCRFSTTTATNRSHWLSLSRRILWVASGEGAMQKTTELSLMMHPLPGFMRTRPSSPSCTGIKRVLARHVLHLLCPQRAIPCLSVYRLAVYWLYIGCI